MSWLNPFKEQKLVIIGTKGTNFVKTHRGFVKIVPQFKIGEYIRAEYARQIPKYRVDFLMTFSKGGNQVLPECDSVLESGRCFRKCRSSA